MTGHAWSRPRPAPHDHRRGETSRLGLCIAMVTVGTAVASRPPGRRAPADGFLCARTGPCAKQSARGADRTIIFGLKMVRCADRVPTAINPRAALWSADRSDDLFGRVRPSYSTFAAAFCASRRIYFPSGLGRLFDLGKPGAVARIAFSLGRRRRCLPHQITPDEALPQHGRRRSNFC
jgi:hypothetical protein